MCFYAVSSSLFMVLLLLAHVTTLLSMEDLFGMDLSIWSVKSILGCNGDYICKCLMNFSSQVVDS